MNVKSGINTTHGMSMTPIYNIWNSLIQRCNNSKTKRYDNYGGRGIKVCERWLKFENFFEDMGERPEGLTIERVDNDKGYYKENCEWATYTDQVRNRNVFKKNKIGVTGISRYKSQKKYRAVIRVNHKSIHLGYFTNLQDAITVRKNAEIKYWNK